MRFLIIKQGEEIYRASIREKEDSRSTVLGYFTAPLEARNFIRSEARGQYTYTHVVGVVDPTENLDPIWIGYTVDDPQYQDVVDRGSDPEIIFGPRIWAKRPNRGMQNRGKST